MMDTFLFLYIAGALIAHWIIYRYYKGNIEHESANILCILWPVAAVIYFIVLLLKAVRQNYEDWKELMK